MRETRRRLSAVLLAGAASTAMGRASAHEGHGKAKEGEAPGRTRVRLAEVELVDHQGRRGLLNRDIIGGRIVVADFVFTTCSSICPVISAVFAQLQQQLPANLRSDVRMLSITVDPLNDTPDRLQAQAQRYGSEPLWRWLTGRVEHVENALKGFGAYVARPDDHLPMAVVGDPAADAWYRFMGMPNPAQLLRTVQQLHAQRGTRRNS